MLNAKYFITLMALMLGGVGQHDMLRAQVVAMRPVQQTPIEVSLHTQALVSIKTQQVSTAWKPKTTVYTSVSGIVVDSLGRPISDATIEIANGTPFSTTYARTSQQGAFATDSLVAGQAYVLTVIRFGYRQVVTQPIVLNSHTGKEVRIVMQRWNSASEPQ